MLKNSDTKYTLYNADCIDIMKTLPESSIDCIITDPPYGTTACKWDEVIPLAEMWEQLHRLIKPKGAIVLFGSQPFTSILVTSNIKNFKYEWIWQKTSGSNFANLKYQPMKEHENILVFSKDTHNYYPIKEERKGSGLNRINYGHSGGKTGEAGGSLSFRGFEAGSYDVLRYQSSVQLFNNRDGERGLHPTQKPLDLMEYLVKTYSKTGDTILDFTMGSGTTGAACMYLNRYFIGIEKDTKYYETALKRLQKYSLSIF